MRVICRTLLRNLRALRRDSRGTVAVIVALSLVVLIAVLGLGIDYYRKLSFKSRMDGAADAAALSAIATAKAYIVNHPGETGANLTTDAVSAGKAQANKAFLANAGLAESEMPAIPQIDVRIDGPLVTATVSYSGAIPSVFGPLVQASPVLYVSGSASSSLAMDDYRYGDVYLYLDVSQSMGLAASVADQQTLYKNTPDKCVFGCHVSMVAGISTDDRSIAKANGVQLRVDVMKEAIAQMFQAAMEAAFKGYPPVRFALNTFDTSVTSLEPITNDYWALFSALSRVDLGQTDAHGPGDTDVMSALNAIGQTVPPSGSGLSQATPQTFIFIITDGTSDLPCQCNYWGHRVAAWDPQACDTIKKNVTIGIIYTTYLPIYNVAGDPSSGFDGRYAGLVLPIASNIAPNLARCASPGFFFQADDGPSLKTAVQALFAQMLGQTARLTK